MLATALFCTIKQSRNALNSEKDCQSNHSLLFIRGMCVLVIEGSNPVLQAWHKLIPVHGSYNYLGPFRVLWVHNI
jgi:hypothetical protein